jgi:hypothetical protein
MPTQAKNMRKPTSTAKRLNTMRCGITSSHFKKRPFRSREDVFG